MYKRTIAVKKSVLSDSKCGTIQMGRGKTKKPPKGLFSTQCAVGQADDLDKSLFELVA